MAFTNFTFYVTWLFRKQSYGIWNSSNIEQSAPCIEASVAVNHEETEMLGPAPMDTSGHPQRD